MVCIALGVEVFRGGTGPPLYIRGGQVYMESPSQVQSEFFYALLQFWGIQLHHLTPQSILRLSIFTHFCEAFLGILPHFHLFQYFFILVPVPNASKPAVVGGCELILRPETRD